MQTDIEKKEKDNSKSKENKGQYCKCKHKREHSERKMDKIICGMLSQKHKRESKEISNNTEVTKNIKNKI